MKRARARRVREETSPYSANLGLLIDSHVWLWWVARDPNLGRMAISLIRAAPEVRLSAATAWELAIKQRQGKLRLVPPLDLAEELLKDRFAHLPVTVAHALRAAALPFHHRDPFDRILVAQAMAEDLVLVTADAALSRYGVRVLDATT